MGDIVEFSKAVKGREKNIATPLPDIASSTSVKRNWHILAVELYANGYTADFISKMNRAARRELIIKSRPTKGTSF